IATPVARDKDPLPKDFTKDDFQGLQKKAKGLIGASILSPRSNIRTAMIDSVPLRSISVAMIEPPSLFPQGPRGLMVTGTTCDTFLFISALLLSHPVIGGKI